MLYHLLVAQAQEAQEVGPFLAVPRAAHLLRRLVIVVVDVEVLAAFALVADIFFDREQALQSVLPQSFLLVIGGESTALLVTHFDYRVQNLVKLRNVLVLCIMVL